MRWETKIRDRRKPPKKGCRCLATPCLRIPRDTGAYPCRRWWPVSGRVRELSAGQVFKAIGYGLIGSASETSFRALDTSSFSRETFSAAYAQDFWPKQASCEKKSMEDDKSVATVCRLFMRKCFTSGFTACGTFPSSEQPLPNRSCASQYRSPRSASRIPQVFR